MTTSIVPLADTLPSEARLTATGLNLPDELRFKDWKTIGQHIAAHGSSLQWAIGDWLAYGDRYRGQYADAMQEIDRAYGTLLIAKHVASRIQTLRRRKNLSFGHHQAVASLEPEQQDAWLDDAIAQNWSVHQLRAEIQAWKQGHASPSQLARISLSAPPERLEQWNQAADLAGTELTDWIFTTLDGAAQRTIRRKAS